MTFVIYNPLSVGVSLFGYVSDYNAVTITTWGWMDIGGYNDFMPFFP